MDSAAGPAWRDSDEGLRAWAMTRVSVAFAVLLLLALGVRIAVPSGFMPVRQNGVTVLTLCSGHGPMMLGHHQHHDAGGQPISPAPSPRCL